MSLNPYESPRTPNEPPTKKRFSDLKLFSSAFKPLLWFLVLFFVLSAFIVIFDSLWVLWFVKS